MREHAGSHLRRHLLHDGSFRSAYLPVMLECRSPLMPTFLPKMRSSRWFSFTAALIEQRVGAVHEPQPLAQHCAQLGEHADVLLVERLVCYLYWLKLKIFSL